MVKREHTEEQRFGAQVNAVHPSAFCISPNKSLKQRIGINNKSGRMKMELLTAQTLNGNISMEKKNKN